MSLILRVYGQGWLETSYLSVVRVSDTADQELKLVVGVYARHGETVLVFGSWK